jgi:hypothetical protein
VNGRHVAAFLGLTFGLTWLLDLVVYLGGGLAASPGIVTVLQFQMLLPGFSAIVLGLFLFPESPLYFRQAELQKQAGPARWFYYYFLLLTVASGLSAAASLIPNPLTVRVVASSTPVVLSLVGLILLVVLRVRTGRKAMERVWLGWAIGQTGSSSASGSSRFTSPRRRSTGSSASARPGRRVPRGDRLPPV